MKHKDLITFIRNECKDRKISHWNIHKFKKYDLLICKDDNFIEVYSKDHLLFYVEPNDTLHQRDEPEYFKFRKIVECLSLNKLLQEQLKINNN